MDMKRIINWFKSLFIALHGNNLEYNVTVFKRKGYDIFMPESVATRLQDLNYRIDLVLYKNKPSSLQVSVLENSRYRYLGTFKKVFGIEGFIDGDICNCRTDNLIFKDEEYERNWWN